MEDGKAIPVKVEKLKISKKPNLGGKTPGHKPLSTNGGARDGAGRKAGGTSLQRRLNKTLLVDHFGEEVDVKVKDPKTGEEHIIKKPRLIIQIERLFAAGVQGGVIDAGAVDKWLNRAVGKAPQPLIGDEDEDPIQVDLGVDRLLGKAYGDSAEDEAE